MLELASSLERVPSARRAELGGWILERTWTDRDPRLWAAIGRIGARVPAYASLDHVVASAVVERWVEQLLREKWDSLPGAADAAVRLARVTGDRARDLSERIRAEVKKRLVATGASVDHVRAGERARGHRRSREGGVLGRVAPGWAAPCVMRRACVLRRRVRTLGE